MKNRLVIPMTDQIHDMKATITKEPDHGSGLRTQTGNQRGAFVKIRFGPSNAR